MPEQPNEIKVQRVLSSVFSFGVFCYYCEPLCFYAYEKFYNELMCKVRTIFYSKVRLYRKGGIPCIHTDYHFSLIGEVPYMCYQL